MNDNPNFYTLKGQIASQAIFTAAQQIEAVGGLCGPLILSRDDLADKLDFLGAPDHAAAIRMFAPQARFRVERDGPVHLGPRRAVSL